MKVSGLALTGNVLLVMGRNMETITAWRLTEEGVVDGPPGDESAGRGSSIWTIPALRTPTVSIAGRTAVIEWDGNATHFYDTVTGEALDPFQTPPYCYCGPYSLNDLMDGRHNLRWLRLPYYEEELPVPLATVQDRRVKDSEGRHRLWIPAAWGQLCHMRWLHNTTTLWLGLDEGTIVVKF